MIIASRNWRKRIDPVLVPRRLEGERNQAKGRL